MIETLWVEKYRPKNIDDCILPKDLKGVFNGFVKSGDAPNMILAGSAGLGKTTVAKALCNQLKLDWIIINGSEESGIDTLRNKIKQFASTVSLTGGIKVVILDEADYLQAQSTQPALRGFIEEFSSNCRFILTCNFKNRIIDPLHSRCSVIEFNTTKKQLAGLAGQFMNRVEYILTEENVSYDKKTIAELIIRHAPDWRRVLSECQRYASLGEIPTSILVGSSDDNIKEVIDYCKDKNFKKMRIWVANNVSLDSSVIYRKIYDKISESAEPESIPAAVLILADYSYKDAMVADKELNLCACFVELMANIKWS